MIRSQEERKFKALELFTNNSNLPSYSLAGDEVFKVIDDPDSTVEQLVKAVLRDQNLVAHILAVANSSFYGSLRRIGSIQQAIVLLGFEQIRNITMALRMFHSMNDINSRAFNYKTHIAHALMTAYGAKKMAEDLGVLNTGEVFTAGLLHDFGIPIIIRNYPKEYEEIIKIVTTEGRALVDAEEELLGTSHQEVAAFVFEHWNLPAPLIDAIANHHTPELTTSKRKTAAFVYASDYATEFFNTGKQQYKEDDLKIRSKDVSLQLSSKEDLENYINNYKLYYQSQIDVIKAL